MRMLQTILTNMSSFFRMYAGQGAVIAVVAFIVAAVFGGWHEKKRTGHFFSGSMLIRTTAAAILAMYVYIVIGITMLSRSEGYSNSMNLRLFSTFCLSFYNRMFIYENILLFVPLGILLYLLAKPFRRIWISLMTGMLCSFCIEISQYITRLGRFELDDILTNTMGMLLGFGISKGLDSIGVAKKSG